MVLTDRELWGCAEEVIKQHGAKSPMHVARRIGELATAGDLAGIATWKAIAARVDQLMDYGGERSLSRQ